MMVRTFLLIGALGCTLAPTVLAQIPRPAAPVAATPESLGLSSQRLAQVSEVLAAAVAEGRINGAVFGIMRQGRLAWLGVEATHHERTRGIHGPTRARACAGDEPGAGDQAYGAHALAKVRPGEAAFQARN